MEKSSSNDLHIIFLHNLHSINIGAQGAVIIIGQVVRMLAREDSIIDPQC